MPGLVAPPQRATKATTRGVPVLLLVPIATAGTARQWRPFAQQSQITEAIANPDNRWGIAVGDTTKWYLAVDLLNASGLPWCEDGTEHWLSVTVSGFQHSDGSVAPVAKETWVAQALGPNEHGARVS